GPSSRSLIRAQVKASRVTGAAAWSSTRSSMLRCVPETLATRISCRTPTGRRPPSQRAPIAHSHPSRLAADNSVTPSRDTRAARAPFLVPGHGGDTRDGEGGGAGDRPRRQLRGGLPGIVLPGALGAVALGQIAAGGDRCGGGGDVVEAWSQRDRSDVDRTLRC